MIELMSHQKRAVEQFSERSVILAHEMGTGKSVTSISMHKEFGAVVVCPTKTKNNYLQELVSVMGESADDIQIIKKGKDIVQGKKWLIISYDLAKKFKDPICEAYKRMIVDESHCIKGDTQRSAGVIEISKNMQVVTLLTGTPVTNRPADLWNQLLAVNAKITQVLRKTEYQKKFCKGHLEYVPRARRMIWVAKGAANLEELRSRILSDVDIVKKSEVLDLPEKIVKTVKIEMTDEQKRRYATAFADYVQKCIELGEKTPKEIRSVIRNKDMVQVVKLRQATSMMKAEYLLEMIEEVGEQQAIIFTEYIATIEFINKGLKERGLSFSTLKQEDGDGKFKRKEVQFFTANINAGAEGLNLQNSSLIFIIDKNWSVGKNWQAEDRVHRKGQTEKCFIKYFSVEETIDEAVDRVNIIKGNAIKRII